MKKLLLFLLLLMPSIASAFATTSVPWIATTTPAQTFSVQGNGLFSGNIFTATLQATGTVSSLTEMDIGSFTPAASMQMTSGQILVNGNSLILASNSGSASLIFKSGNNTQGAVLTSTQLFGIATTTPYARLSVDSGASTGDAFAVSTSSTHAVFGIDNDGHQWTSGPAGTVSSCGTGTGTVVGDDQSGVITTATAATTCTYTFSKAYRVAPTCRVTDDSLVGFADIATPPSTTAVTFGISSALTGGHLYYECRYHQ